MLDSYVDLMKQIYIRFVGLHTDHASRLFGGKKEVSVELSLTEAVKT